MNGKDVKIGQTVWYPSVVWSAELLKCPVCNGTSYVLVKPVDAPDEAGTKVRCDYCSQALTDTPGYKQTNWKYRPSATPLLVHEIIVARKQGGDEYEFRQRDSRGSYTQIAAEKCYDNKEDAERNAIEIAERSNKKYEQELLDRVKHEKGRGSWGAGYHREQVAYHQYMLGLIDKAKLDQARKRKK